MELYYSQLISNGHCTLEGDEASHCMRVMRNKVGDRISVIDGSGTLYDCRIDAAPGSRVECSILASQEGYRKHPYSLTMAVALTKNMERFEWFAEKATELGIDRIVPLVGDFSIRKSFNRERLERIVIGAAKQSLKAYIPRLDDATRVADFIASCASPSASHPIAPFNSAHSSSCISPSEESTDNQSVKLICYCGDSYPKTFVTDALKAVFIPRDAKVTSCPEIVILIGPEGDFSQAETEAAISAGFHCVTLGDARLRVETAALLAVSAVNLHSQR